MFSACDAEFMLRGASEPRSSGSGMATICNHWNVSELRKTGSGSINCLLS